MKLKNLFPILLFTCLLLLLAPNPAVALLDEKVSKLPYQINYSDRIMISTVSGIDPHFDYSIVTVKVKEWIYNPFPAKVIKIRTEIGTNGWTEDEAEFTLNESVLLMLKDENLDEQLFRVAIGFPGKHPVSDRNAVIQELIAQGKLQGEDQTENMKNGTEAVDNTEIIDNQKENVNENKTVDYGKEEKTEVGKQKGVGSTIESKRVPFISPIWVLATFLVAILCVRRK
jgi:hypothetical protein